MKESKLGDMNFESQKEGKARNDMLELFKKNPIPDDELLSNLGLFINSKNLSRILFFHHLYFQIIDVPGVIMEFGTRWGQNASLFAALRGIYDPFNRHRKIVMFDTFEGFPSLDVKDGTSSLMKEGNLSVTEGYEKFLEKIIEAQENDNPLEHIKKFDILKGDSTKTLPEYLEDNPETIVSLAYFDFDIYKPTKDCLDLIKTRLVKGSILGFDELNDHDSPGETAALMEVFGLNNVKLKRFPITSRASYFVFE